MAELFSQGTIQELAGRDSQHRSEVSAKAANPRSGSGADCPLGAQLELSTAVMSHGLSQWLGYHMTQQWISPIYTPRMSVLTPVGSPRVRWTVQPYLCPSLESKRKFHHILLTSLHDDEEPLPKSTGTGDMPGATAFQTREHHDQKHSS